MKYGFMDDEMEEEQAECKKISPCPSVCSCSSCEFEIVQRDSETGELSCKSKQHDSSESKKVREHDTSTEIRIKQEVLETTVVSEGTQVEEMTTPEVLSRLFSLPSESEQASEIASTSATESHRHDASSWTELPLTTSYTATRRSMANSSNDMNGRSYRMIVTRRLQSLSSKEILRQTQAEFQAYCRGWFECQTGQSSEVIPAEVIGDAGEAYLILRNAIHSIEKLFEHNAFFPPADLSEQLINLKKYECSNSPFAEIISDRLACFAIEFERRNAEAIEESRHESFQRIIDAAVIHVEEELQSIFDHYAEPEHLQRICEQVVMTTQKNFADSADLSQEDKQKYARLLDNHLRSCVDSVKRRNEHLLSRTQAEIERAVEESFTEYRKFLLEKRQKLRGPKWQLALMCGAHETVMYDTLQTFTHKCLRSWPHCPGLCEEGRRKLIEKLVGTRQDERFGISMFQQEPVRESQVVGSGDRATDEDDENDPVPTKGTEEGGQNSEPLPDLR